MSKLNLRRLSSGYRSSNALNNDFELIEEALDNTLSRNGTGPNMMLAPLDMNDNPILNVPEPVDPTDLVRKQDVENIAVEFVTDEIENIATVAGTAAGGAAGTVSANVVVAGKANVNGDNVTPDIFRTNIDIIELFSDAVGLRRLGYVGDGQSHTLASVAPSRTLSEWQDIFPANATSGSLGALNLTDQIDGLAVQRAIDIQYDSGVGDVAITLPPGDGVISRPIRTNGLTPVTVTAPGGNGTGSLVLIFSNATDSAWEHGLITPGGPLCFDGVTLRGQSSGYAVQINSGSDFSFLFRDHYFTGFDGGVDGFNCRSSGSYGGVLSTFGAPNPRTKHAYRLQHDQPCFQVYIGDKQIFGFDSPVEVTNTSIPGIEGVHVVGVQINECNHPFILSNTLYDAPDFKLIDCEIETFQSALGLWGRCQGVDICGNYVITLGSSLVAKGLHLNGSKRVKVKDNKINIIANSFTRLFDFENTVSCEMAGNDIVDVVSVGKTYTSNFIWLTGTNVGFREYDTTLDASSGLSVGGATAGLSIEFIALTVGGTVDRAGRYTLPPRIIAGTTDANGDLTVTYPNRPDGTPLFSVEPVVVCSKGDTAFGPQDTVAPVQPGSNTTLKLRFKDATTGAIAASVLRHANYIVAGV